VASVGEQIRELAGLLEDGLISSAQFEVQKEALLAGNRTTAPQGASSPSLGSSVGAYQVQGHVGEGGMGAVFRGRHRTAAIAARQGGDVAIKVMHAQYARNEDFQNRFEREASLGLKLDHPGVIKVYDLVVDGGNLALVMELVEGRPLSEVIGNETGPIPWSRARPMFAQLLAAVGHAHSHGVVHRDLKPENVMVTTGGVLKILDFGIAKETDSGATRTGTGMGTVHYMAPEQYTDAKHVDSRADIYALGMTLYEMLAGRLPWQDTASDFEILNLKAQGGISPPTDFYPDIAPEVVAVLMRALSVERSRRPQSAEQFAAELDGQSTTGAVAPPVVAAPHAAAPAAPQPVISLPPAQRGGGAKLDPGLYNSSAAAAGASQAVFAAPDPAPPRRPAPVPAAGSDAAVYSGPGTQSQDSSALASRGARVGAYLLDFLTLGLLGILATIIEENTYDPDLVAFVVILGCLVLLAINAFLLARRGQTIGKALVKVRIARLDGFGPGLGRILILRVLPIVLVLALLPPPLNLFALALNFLSALGRNQRCLHDYVAGTRVVVAAGNPEDWRRPSPGSERSSWDEIRAERGRK